LGLIARKKKKEKKTTTMKDIKKGNAITWILIYQDEAMRGL